MVEQLLLPAIVDVDDICEGNNPQLFQIEKIEHRPHSRSVKEHF
jgi:hypothetical protein